MTLRFLNSKPRRSLYKLRLKFVQTTRVVSRKYYVLTNLSARTHIDVGVVVKSPLGRYAHELRQLFKLWCRSLLEFILRSL